MNKIVKKFFAVIASCAVIFACAAVTACSETGGENYEESEMIKEANGFIELNKSGVNGRYKGVYHLSPETGWMNDPNGFVYFNNKYHIFWQYHPYAPTNGVMYWGHAVSDDLISWEYLPVALAPDKDYDADGCWSGSAIAVGNRLYLIYTGHYERGGKRVQTQNLAYSDDGVHFTKYSGNPVIGEDKLPAGTSIADFRDPYVWRNGDKYYMLVGTMEAGAAKVLLYKSDDLFDWRYVNAFLRRTDAGYCWECPSLVNIGGSDVFICSPVDYPNGKYEFWNYNSNVYAVGNVDYAAGVMTASDFSEIDAGLDFYAAQAIKGKDGKIVMTAWMNMWNRSYIPARIGDGWTGSLVLPRELSLKDGKLLQRPAAAIENYYKNRVTAADNLSGKKSYDGVAGTVLHLGVTADITRSSEFSVRLFADGEHDTVLKYDKTAGELSLDRSGNLYKISADPREKSRGVARTAEYKAADGVLRLEIFIDKSSIEVFAGDGELTMTALSYNAPSAGGIVFESVGETTLTVVKDDIIV